MKKEDLTRMTDNELSLLVFNTVDLYRIRHNITLLKHVIDHRYTYNKEQYNILIIDLMEELLHD